MDISYLPKGIKISASKPHLVYFYGTKNFGVHGPKELELYASGFEKHSQVMKL